MAQTSYLARTFRAAPGRFSAKPLQLLALSLLLVTHEQQHATNLAQTRIQSILPHLAQARAEDERPCETDDFCAQFYEYDICDTAPEDSPYDKVCTHKPLFPLTTREWIGTFVFTFIMLLSTVGGIGGGGIAIPLAMYFFALPLKYAISLSSFSIMLATIARWLFNFNERHPEKPNCACLDYGLANVMMPLTILGSMVGAYFYQSFPDMYLQIILTLLLAFLSWTSWKKFRQIYKKENEQALKDESMQKVKPIDTPMKGDNEKEGTTSTKLQKSENNPTHEENSKESATVHEGGKTEGEMPKKETRPTEEDFQRIIGDYNLPQVPSGNEQTDKEVSALRSMIRQEMGHGQWKKQGINLLCLALMIIISFLRGGKSEISFEKCGAADWSAVAIFICLLILMIYISTTNIATEQEIKQKYNNANLVESDLVFKGSVLTNVLGLGFGGGWVAGALGLGGGVVFNPLLLSMGVPPRVSSATGMYLVTFSKVSTCLLYFIFGLLKIDYSLWIALWSSAGGVAGLWATNWYMARFGRQSIIVLCLTIVLLLSVVGVPYFGARDLIKAHDNGDDITAFKSIC